EARVKPLHEHRVPVFQKVVDGLGHVRPVLHRTQDDAWRLLPNNLTEVGVPLLWRPAHQEDLNPIRLGEGKPPNPIPGPDSVAKEGIPSAALAGVAIAENGDDNLVFHRSLRGPNQSTLRAHRPRVR